MGTAVALGMDAFAVALAVASTMDHLSFRHTFRLTWHFGLFQWLMTVLGWAGGMGLIGLLHGFNDLVAFALLTILGINMIRGSRSQDDLKTNHDPTRGLSLVGLSVATSIDALAVGVSLSLIGMSIWMPALVIGIVALLMTFLGIKIGRKAGAHLGEWAELIGGIVLICIGVKIIAQRWSL